MRPTLAVLVTYHDERELLRECLESVLSQPERPDEVIVYDDASTAPAADYLPAHANVRVVRGETNRGPAVGRNLLLNEAQSDFIHFHDADDLFHPDWCSRVRAALIEPVGPDVVFTEVASYVGDSLVAERVIGLAAVLAGQDLVEFCIQAVMLVPAGTYRRGLVSSVGGYRESLWQSEDFDFHIRLAAHGIRYTIVDEPLVLQRIRAASRSQDRAEAAASMVQSLRLLADELPVRYRQALAERAARAGSVLFRAGARRDAREAFQLAARSGRPNFVYERRLYRVLARAIGPELAERAGSVYRRGLPHRMRRRVAEAGW